MVGEVIETTRVLMMLFGYLVCNQILTKKKKVCNQITESIFLSFVCSWNIFNLKKKIYKMIVDSAALSFQIRTSMRQTLKERVMHLMK